VRIHRQFIAGPYSRFHRGGVMFPNLTLPLPLTPPWYQRELYGPERA
jgi:hypothetical protein